VTWAGALPNLLIGLREGLEAGLVVSILLAALRKTTPRPSSAPVWLGVLGAVALAGSFAAVLTYSTDVLSSHWQEAVGGLLSVLAVGLVTAMIFWMRRTAASLSTQLRDKVATALSAGALAVTAFLAVGREGLETTLFLWTAVRASGQTVTPLIGAGLGLAVAVLLCRLLFRRAIRLNLGVFFNRTALALIVIAAGVLAYGLGDLQDAGLLAGHDWMAFDVSGQVDASSWWMSIITGVTDLSPRMTVLQAVAWVVYLAVVIPVFLRAGAAAPDKKAAPDDKADLAKKAERERAELGPRRRWALAFGLVVVPVAAAGTAIALLPSSSASAATEVSVTASACAPEWHTGHTGAQRFEVANRSGRAGEVNLDNAAGAVVAEIETLGPATTAPLTVTLESGIYTFKCRLPGQATVSSAPVQVTGAAVAAAPPAVTPVTVADLQPAVTAYRRYVAPELVTLTGQVTAIESDLRRRDMARARLDWLAAQLTWEQVGAAYDSFADLGDAIDGLPQGLPGGAGDPSFAGLHRLEYGLWHGQPAATLAPIAGRLIRDVAELRRQLPTLTVDPTDLPVRAHEILEDAQRDHLSGMTDQGAGAAYRETYADVQGTRVVLGELAPLITARSPHLVATIDTQLGTLQSALRATGFKSLTATPSSAREDVDAALGAVLESLSAVPDLLEVPPNR
jgi:high-affinity iron transporter